MEIYTDVLFTVAAADICYDGCCTLATVLDSTDLTALHRTK